MWKNRNVWILLCGELIAGIGLWTGIIGNLEFLQQHVPSDFLKSLILFTGLLAGVIVAPLAGRIIDSNSKKKVMIYASFGRMISVLFMFLAIEFGSVWWMVCFMISIQLSAAFYFPALQALVPMVVKENDLLQMNGAHMNMTTIARIIGTALAGVMLVFMSLYSLYLASFVAYGFLLFSTYLLSVEEDDKMVNMPKKDKKAASFKEVLPVLKGLPIAMTALILTMIPMLFLGGFNLMVIAISELQQDPTIKGLIYTVEGCFFMLGAYLVKRVADKINPITLMFVITGVVAVIHLSLYFAEIKWLALTSFGFFGLAIGFFFPITATIFQTKVPKEFHGRFFSFRSMLDRVMFQVVLLATGLFLDTIGFQYMVLVFGTISLIIVGYFAFKHWKPNTTIQEPLPHEQKASSV
ncbi:MFS transporter [Anaerobacillus isosaccharinicus]|uniref:MFS transporter n=1 Tax=Anaerobacillus isosaccharinicus TaxID=1532552 RepID=A0A7S7L8Q0_9BACI|nr:MFS transporter [Anaerobacillus isosaccharinicus]MBA5585215.1 MFS transporter [Anaerobacillus isosaccharinicus]QOY36450.1 MFS transporter [Anaerobacillus isosaccharinicus]